MKNEAIKQAFKIGVEFQKNPVESAIKLADLTAGSVAVKNEPLCVSCVKCKESECISVGDDYPSYITTNVGMGCIVTTCNKHQKL